MEMKPLVPAQQGQVVQGQAMPVHGEVQGQVVTVHQPQAAIATPVPVHVQGQVLATPAPVVQGQVMARPQVVMAQPQVMMAQPQVTMAQPGQPGAVVPFGGGTGIPGAPPGGVNVNISWCGPISWSICFVASRAPELRRAPRASFVRRLHATRSSVSARPSCISIPLAGRRLLLRSRRLLHSPVPVR